MSLDNHAVVVMEYVLKRQIIELPGFREIRDGHSLPVANAKESARTPAREPFTPTSRRIRNARGNNEERTYYPDTSKAFQTASRIRLARLD